jgi:hypothetical protein
MQKMQRKTLALLKAFKRAIADTPDKPTSVIAKELGVSAQRLYQIKHIYMQSLKRAIKKKDYGVTKVHAVAEHTPTDYAVFANPATTRAVLHAKLNQEHEALTKDYIELHDQHLALKKRFDDAQKEAYRFQVETFDLKAIVKYLEGKAGQE